jgi:hypothetical protein
MYKIIIKQLLQLLIISYMGMLIQKEGILFLVKTHAFCEKASENYEEINSTLPISNEILGYALFGLTLVLYIAYAMSKASTPSIQNELVLNITAEPSPSISLNENTLNENLEVSSKAEDINVLVEKTFNDVGNQAVNELTDGILDSFITEQLEAIHFKNLAIAQEHLQDQFSIIGESAAYLNAMYNPENFSLIMSLPPLEGISVGLTVTALLYAVNKKEISTVLIKEYSRILQKSIKHLSSACTERVLIETTIKLLYVMYKNLGGIR